MQHTLYTVLKDTSFLPPRHQPFFNFVYSEITGKSDWWVLFRLPSLAIGDAQNLTHFDSGLLIYRTILPRAGSSCTLLYFVFSVLYTKNALKSTVQQIKHHLFRPFYSFLHNWVITEVLVCPVYVLYEFIGFFISMFVFLSLLPLFTVVASWIVLLIRTSPVVPRLHHYFGMLTSLFSSACLPLLGHMECPLALIVPQTLMFLSFWANLTLL